MIDLAGSRVLVTGGGGFLGRRIVAALQARGADAVVSRSSRYDLTDPAAVPQMLKDIRPRFVIHAAAVVGGIGANRARPADFFYENAVMGIHLIHESLRAGVEKLVVVGTVCSYPKFTPVPFQESELWSGYPEETNAPYGIAKKMLLVQSQTYRAQFGFNSVYVIPSNLYGPGDNFHPATSHVIPAIILKCMQAVRDGSDEVVLWGTGTPTREFLYVDDAAEGLVLALEKYDEPEPLNLGAAHEVAIAELATAIAEICGYHGRFVWDQAQPDGQPRRAVDGSRANAMLGWKSQVSLEEGLRRTFEWCRQNLEL